MKKVIHTNDAPKAIGPYSQAIESNGMVFVSGQLPINPTTMNIEEKDIEKQCRQVFDNIGAILKAAGCSFSNVIKTTILLKNIEDFAKVNALYASYFTGDYPARTTYQVADLPLQALIEIEVIAIKE